MDKNKIIEAAAKLVAKGAYDKAIKEYRRILDVDPKDVRVLQKMGELYQKKNDNEQAASYFTKVAESYSSDGFFLKSVALYKQVLKLDPNLLEINLRLAELHQQLQLISEATSYYQIVAQHHEKAGNTKGSLDTLKKIIELDPESVSARIKLGDMYARGKMKAEATEEFKRAAEYLRRNSRIEEYQRVLDRLSSLEGDNLALAREVAESYLAKGDAKRAVAKLQQCFKLNPGDEKTLILLTDAFQALGQVSKTISVHKELAKIYAGQNRTAEANQLWAKIEQLDPQDPDLVSRGGGRPPHLPNRQAARPSPARGSSLPSAEASFGPAAADAPKPTREQLVKLLKETDVYVKYGLHDKALEHLGKIFSSDPEDLDAHEKAYQVYIASGNEAQAAEQLLNVLRLCARLRAVDRAQPYLKRILQQAPDHPEVGTFISILGREETPVHPVAEIEMVPEDAILVDTTNEEIVVPEPPPGALGFSGDDLALEASLHGDEVVDDEVLVPFHADEGATPAAPLHNHTVDAASESLPTVVVEPSELHATDDRLRADYDLEEDTAEWDSENPKQEGLPSDDQQTPAYELEIDESAAGTELASEDIELAGFESGDVPRMNELESESGDLGAEADPAAEECEEARFFLDQGLLDEAREILETVLIAYPGYLAAQELLERLERSEASQRDVAREELPPSESVESVSDGRDAFDLAAELASELGELGIDETSDGEAVEEDFQYSVDEVFAEFKKGLEKVVPPEDVDTHYDLGIAYKEMGLIEDAIGEFSVARQGCVGKKKEIDCLTMIALLQKTKGDAAGAVESYKRALVSEHAMGETEKALEFELAAAWESLGNPGKALYHYARVAKLDAQYRDVASIVSRLSRTAKPDPDPLPAKKAPGGRSGGGSNGANGFHARSADSDRAVADESSNRSQVDPPVPGGKTRKAGFV